jgi:hypothetical protein
MGADCKVTDETKIHKHNIISVRSGILTVLALKCMESCK